MTTTTTIVIIIAYKYESITVLGIKVARFVIGKYKPVFKNVLSSCGHYSTY
jgi:hypothetical protein